MMTNKTRVLQSANLKLVKLNNIPFFDNIPFLLTVLAMVSAVYISAGSPPDEAIRGTIPEPPAVAPGEVAPDRDAL
ncbi:MAG: hypothetical protein SWY16_13645 [Cyanobacteriota bacterium]|nr:hypothetical protein [Cyanobacteriota bacterium]